MTWGEGEKEIRKRFPDVKVESGWKAGGWQSWAHVWAFDDADTRVVILTISINTFQLKARPGNYIGPVEMGYFESVGAAVDHYLVWKVMRS